MTKIVVYIEGGMVTEVRSDSSDVEVTLCDRDVRKIQDGTVWEDPAELEYVVW